MNQELSTTVGRLIETYFPQLRRTVRKNLTRLTCAFLRLALSVRFGYGGLHLTSVARVLPQGVNFKSSYKWLSRFLKCKYFDPSSLAECMFALILGRKPLLGRSCSSIKPPLTAPKSSMPPSFCKVLPSPSPVSILNMPVKPC